MSDTTIQKEVDAFEARHPSPLHLLQARYKYHLEASRDKFEERKKPTLKNGSPEVEIIRTIYLKHKQRADEYELAIRILEMGGMDA
jgi:hypothetical protein